MRTLNAAAMWLCLFAFPVKAAVVSVSTEAELRTAVDGAQPGDEIVLSDGVYTFTSRLQAAADGADAAPIIVRAQNALGAQLRFNTLEGFLVTGRNWRFEGLDVQGICPVDSDCEHAFHVVGRAENFVLRESRLRDFNAQLKVNAAPDANGVWEIPHRGLVERNVIGDTQPRDTANPVTKLNIDTGDGWVVRDNLIYDFHKNGGDFISYGAFMKSGGSGGVFERNLVFCNRNLATAGTRIGLSFGGGGTAPAFCAPAFDAAVPCDPEHRGGILRNNIIVDCSDVGIYLNRAANTRVLFNTLIGTNGVDFRYPSSTGLAHGNVMSSIIRDRDGASFDAGTNLLTVALGTFESWYQAPMSGDFTVTGDVSSLIAAAERTPLVQLDFCARNRPAQGPYTLGAIEHSLGDCTWPGDAGAQEDGGVQTDGGVATDGGIVDGGGGGGTVSRPPDTGGPSGPPTPTGCGCSGAAANAAPLFALIAAIALRARRRQ